MQSVYHSNPDQAQMPKVNTAPDTGKPDRVKEGTIADSYKVKLSPEGLKTASEDTEKDAKDTSAIDLAIEKLQEQIKAVTQQLNKLENDDSGGANSQKTMLNNMLADLNAQLISLIAKKLDIN